LQKSPQVTENKWGDCEKDLQEKPRVRKLLVIKELKEKTPLLTSRDAQHMREAGDAPPGTPAGMEAEPMANGSMHILTR
jgi:hypothetical protein